LAGERPQGEERLQRGDTPAGDNDSKPIVLA
jgi:hypothetical protein